MKVTKQFEFSMSHRLQYHEGLCWNIHGHNYVVEVTIEDSKVQEEGPETGMVMGFGNLKKICNELFDELDHAFMVNVSDKAVKGFFKNQGFKTYEVDFEPTAENMAEHIYNELLPPIRSMNISLHSVRVWETASAYATYTKP